MDNVGKYSFLVGLILAVVMAFVEVPMGATVLAVLGLVVGFLNVSGKETQSFLLASIGLMMSAAAVNGLPEVGAYAGAVAANFVAFISPAVLVVAVKSLLETARD